MEYVSHIYDQRIKSFVKTKVVVTIIHITASFVVLIRYFNFVMILMFSKLLCSILNSTNSIFNKSLQMFSIIIIIFTTTIWASVVTYISFSKFFGCVISFLVGNLAFYACFEWTDHHLFNVHMVDFFNIYMLIQSIHTLYLVFVSI